jgi:uncharacterized membrane protein
VNKLNNPLNNKSTEISKSKKTALTAIMSALIAVTTMIAVPLPPPLSTINFAPIIIFIVSILFGVRIGAVSTAIGCAIGYLAGTSMGTIIVPPSFLYIYLVGLIAARTPMAIATSVLRKKSETVGMALGVTTEMLIFFTIDLALFGITFAVFDFAVLIDLVFIPITFIVLLGIRKVFGANYFV